MHSHFSIDFSFSSFLLLSFIFSTLVCILLHYLTENETYAVVHSLLNQPKIKHYSTFDISLFSRTLVSLLQVYSPDLYDHITENIHANFAESWFTRLFVTYLPYPVVLRVFDCFISEGKRFEFHLFCRFHLCPNVFYNILYHLDTYFIGS